jgi:prophage DNA circulation protein
MAADVLSQLFAFKWRDVEVPISKMRFSLAHDLVEHKYYGVNGARVEDTGLAPIRIHATITLTNGIVPGQNEHWSAGDVYGLLRPFIIAFSKRETGILWHPEFGGIACKAEHLDIDWDALKRGGCEAEASWVENIDDDVAHQIAPSPVAAMQGAAADLDGSVEDIRDLVPSMPVYSESLESLMDKVTSSFDQISLATSRLTAPLNRVVYRVQQIQDAADRAKNALTWPITMNAETVKASAGGLRKQLAEANREIGLYRVPGDTTLAGVTMQIVDADLVDIIRLNPDLMRQPLIPTGTVVRYFGKKLAA